MSSQNVAKLFLELSTKITKIHFLNCFAYARLNWAKSQHSTTSEYKNLNSQKFHYFSCGPL
jgi:hypothetical protein